MTTYRQLNLAQQASELLGPIIEQYLRELDQRIRYLDDGKTAFLFLTRAGVRIHQAYQIYLSRLGKPLPNKTHIFFASRLLVCKGICSLQPSLSINTIGKQLSDSVLEDTLQLIHPTRFRNGSVGNSDLDLPIQPLHEFVASNHPYALELKNYLNDQSQLFSNYLEQTIGDSKRVILIDSGWEGTSQKLLATAFSDLKWMGLYFGWMVNSHEWDSNKWGSATGLVFEGSYYNPRKPATAITIHRHLFESLFESNGPSLEELMRDPVTGQIVAPGWERVVQETFDVTSDPLYVGVLDYLSKSNPQQAGESLARYQRQIRILAEKLAFPSEDDVTLLHGKPRSADFGRKLLVPPVTFLNNRKPDETPQLRIERSLWPEGQIALEYKLEKARRMQRRRISEAELPSPESALIAKPRGNRGKVAIITRTKDRPILFERAARSVSNQTYTDYVWVVVNDGGDQDAVIEVIKNNAVPSHQIILCSNEKSVGMEAASNIGIKASLSEYIVIHDDDDSWHPDFLRKTVAYLESKSGKKYGGVITHSVYISEEISGNKVIEWGRWPYQDWVQHIQLSEVIIENFFPPIAFLFHRDICERIGMFDENLPVLGDWDFAIRFLIRADIGVLIEPLAYYHHRDRGNSGAYSNSVIGGISKHIEYNAILRNKYIRGSVDNPEWGVVSALLAQGYIHRDIRSRLGGLVKQTTQQTGAASPSADSMFAADQRWCLIQIIRHERKGLLGIFRAFQNVSDDARLMERVTKTPLKPPPDFDDMAYLQRYTDVAQKVGEGKFASGFDHFIKHGRAEGRYRPYQNQRP